MPQDPLLRHLRGPTEFLRRDGVELARWFSGIVRHLPLPRRILLQPGQGVPIHGFPILDSDGLADLATRLETVIALAWARERDPSLAAEDEDRAWEAYAEALSTAIENVSAASYAQDYSQIFWLYHSRQLAGIWSRVAEDSDASHQRYRVLDRYLDRVFDLVYRLVERFARERELEEEALFPTLLTAMRDNVLILSEETIDRDLTGLETYLRGYLQIDAEDFLERKNALEAWCQERSTRDPAVHAALTMHGGDQTRALYEPGTVQFLSQSAGYDRQRFFDPEQILLWERLLLRLKEFELFDSLRKLCVHLEPHGALFLCDQGDLETIGLSVAVAETRTRPIDFMAPWLIDPEVTRGGLMYDLTDFSEVLTSLSRLADGEPREEGFRGLFRFQRHLDRLASDHGLRFEKYLGDGAFYTAMELAQLLVAAIEMQRAYRQFVGRGFAFDRGMRMALNHGDYRLVAFGDENTRAERYEAFGQGILELARLVSGKARLRLEDLRSELTARGIDAAKIDGLLEDTQRVPTAPIKTGDRRFVASIDADGHLINEGLVATTSFLAEVWADYGPLPMTIVELPHGRFIGFEVVTPVGSAAVAFRRIGVPILKGIDPLVVYEGVDLELMLPNWREALAHDALPSGDLLAAIDGLCDNAPH